LNKTLLSYLLPLQHAGLIWQLAVREVAARYRQSWLGALWVVITPLLMLATLTFVFRWVFKLRWGEAGVESDLGFALRLFAGLAVFNFFSECVTRAPRLVIDQPHLVKKVIFPVEIFPWVNVLAALAQLGVAWLLLLALLWWDQGFLPVSALALPLVWLPLVPLCLGLGWLFAGLGTYVRDLGQVLVPAVSLLLFLSPIFFPVQALPLAAQPWVMLNPLATPITLTRVVLLDGHWPDWSAWAVHGLACLVLAWLGAAFFKAVRKGFADVV
jgi:lipopolysaccharide transport system permease protein